MNATADLFEAPDALIEGGHGSATGTAALFQIDPDDLHSQAVVQSEALSDGRPANVWLPPAVVDPVDVEDILLLAQKRTSGSGRPVGVFIGEASETQTGGAASTNPLKSLVPIAGDF